MRAAAIVIHNFRSIANAGFALGHYSLMVGANNSGKSNIMDALRVFYEKGLKYEEGRDKPRFKTDDDESWIDIEFVLTDDEYSNLKNEYKRPYNRVKVRKYLRTQEKGADGKPKQGIYAYIGDSVSDEHFYGAKNVQQGKLGDIIYIPAVSRLDDHTKLTGPSALRDLLNEILKKLVKSSKAFAALTSGFESFTKDFKLEETDDKKSLAGLEKDINDEIGDWDAGFELLINPVTEADIIKNLVAFKIIDKALDQKLEAAQFGQGFQRHLIFTLIKTAAAYQPVAKPEKKKEFSPDMTLLLFEEPEAFLHPSQQNTLCQSLQKVALTAGNQVLLSSHSPHFVSQNADDIPSIVRLCRNNAKTVTGQIDAGALKGVFGENQQINALLKGTSYEAEADDLNEEMEAVKYFLWLDSERCGMFFARQVLMVEGPTEKALFNFLLSTGQIKSPKGGVFVLDCIGKFNIHRFMNLCGPLNIPHSVLFDADKGRPPHDKIKALIESNKNAQTYKIATFPEDIEAFLEIPKTSRPHRKPQHVMFCLREGKIAKNKINAAYALLESLLQY